MIGRGLGRWSSVNKVRKEGLLNHTQLLLKKISKHSAPPHLRTRIPHWAIVFIATIRAVSGTHGASRRPFWH